VQGRFITFEGGEGAGKSTQLKRVADWLRGQNVAVTLTREPGGTPRAERLREILLERDGEPMPQSCELLLMFAARATHLANLVVPAMGRGEWVLCDRFTDATYAYQAGGRGVAQERIAALERWVHADLQPDLTLLFDVPPDVAARRLARTRAADRFEAEEIGFFQAVRREYLARAGQEPARFFVVDGTRPPEALRLQLTELMQRWSG